jgi:thiamine biosynthesis protein ThiS
MPSGELSITVNGESREVSAGTTVARLVQQLQLTPGRFAVEINRRIVPRADHGKHKLAGGDAVEIVTFVGGG